MPLFLTLASRNCFHRPAPLCFATLIGIVFAIVLVMVQLGLYLGLGYMVTIVIDHASADLWVVAKGTKSFEDPSLIETRIGDPLRAIDGVAAVSPVAVGFANWRLPMEA